MGTTGSASDGSEVTGATTYCTSAEVSKFLFGDKKGDFSESTKPLKTTVEALINRVEDDIDAKTRHAWRAVTVTNEYHNYNGIRKRATVYPLGKAPCKCIFLDHKSINTLTSGTHKIEVWQNDEWVDLVLTANGYTESRNDDYWVDYQNGIIYFVDEEPDIGDSTVRVTYAYGESSVPGDIKEWCLKQVAIDLIYSDDWTAMTLDNLDRVNLEGKVRHWKEDIKEILKNREELVIV